MIFCEAYQCVGDLRYGGDDDNRFARKRLSDDRGDMRNSVRIPDRRSAKFHHDHSWTLIWSVCMCYACAKSRRDGTYIISELPIDDATRVSNGIP